MVQYLGVNDCSFFPSDWIRCLSPFRYTIIYVDSFTCHWGQVGSSCRACGRHNGQSLTIFPTMHLIQCLAFLPHNLPLTYYIHVKIVKFTIKSMICIYGFNFPLIEIFKPFIDPKLFFFVHAIRIRSTIFDFRFNWCRLASNKIKHQLWIIYHSNWWNLLLAYYLKLNTYVYRIRKLIMSATIKIYVRLRTLIIIIWCTSCTMNFLYLFLHLNHSFWY